MAEKRAWLTNPTTGEKLHAWSHVKSIFYNKATNILLKDKLDEMDKLIDEKIKKAMMSNVQINDQNKVPTSALAFAMNQAITQNKNAITQLNSDLGKDYWSTVGKVEVISPNSWHKSNISITLPPGTYILGYKAHGNISANAYINTKIDNAAESFPLYEKEINMPLSIADGSTLRSVSNVVMRLNNSEVTLYFWAYSTIVTSITCEVWAIRIK